MAKNNATTLLINGAIIALIVVALIGSISEESLRKTTQTLKLNEVVDISTAKLVANNINTSKTFTIAQAPSGWKAQTTDCNIATEAYSNASTDFTVTTDYALSTAGVLTLVNSTAMVRSLPNTTYVDYKYCADDYLNTSWGRSLLNMSPGLIALALLVAVILVAYQLLGKQDED